MASSGCKEKARFYQAAAAYSDRLPKRQDMRSRLQRRSKGCC